jgi:hypothetical protein
MRLTIAKVMLTLSFSSFRLALLIGLQLLPFSWITTLICPSFQRLLLDWDLTLRHSLTTNTQSLEDTGIYKMEEDNLWGFICPSPKSQTAPRPRTEVDLVLLPVSAFSKKGISIYIMLRLGDWIYFMRYITGAFTANFWPKVCTMAISVCPHPKVQWHVGDMEMFEDTG